MKNQKIIIPLVCAIVFIGLLLIFQNPIFYIKNIKVVGNDYIDPKYFIDICKKYKGNLLTINRKSIINEMSRNSFIKNVGISKQLLGTLIVQVQPKMLVGVIDNGIKLRYIDEKGEIFWEDSSILKIKLPIFITLFTEKNDKIVVLAKELAILKYNDPTFFAQISKIDLSKSQETDIFMDIHKRVYSFIGVPNLKELIKIKFLEAQHFQGREISIRGDSIIVKD